MALTLDNFLVAAYLASFVMTFIIATSRLGKSIHANLRSWILGSLCFLAVGAAAVDYYENFSLFAHVSKASSSDIVVSHIAEITRLKSALVVACLCIVFPMQYGIARSLSTRWKR